MRALNGHLEGGWLWALWLLGFLLFWGGVSRADYVAAGSGDGTTAPWFVFQHWHGNPPHSASLSWQITYEYEPWYDPRGFSSFPLAGSWGQQDTLHCTWLSTYVNTMDFLQVSANGYSPQGGTGSAGWPSTVITTAAVGTTFNGVDLHSNGTYRLHMYGNEQQPQGCALTHDLSIIVYLVNGAWTTEPPGGSPPPARRYLGIVAHRGGTTSVAGVGVQARQGYAVRRGNGGDDRGA